MQGYSSIVDKDINPSSKFPGTLLDKRRNMLVICHIENRIKAIAQFRGCLFKGL